MLASETQCSFCKEIISVGKAAKLAFKNLGVKDLKNTFLGF